MSFHENCSYLTLKGKNGTILVPEKFVFVQPTVDWAQYRVTMAGIEPLPEHLEAIRNYPMSTNLTNMRNFFALAEQVAMFIMVKPHLHPFRELLKKDRKFYWDANLQRMFEEVKK